MLPWRAVSRAFLFAALFIIPPAPSCLAGAFLFSEGQGQFIAGVGYSEGSRRFDPSGTPVVAPSFRKAEAAGYLEYGLTARLTLIAAPTLAHEHDGPATNAFNGSDGSAFGARYGLVSWSTGILAVQALAEPPIGNLHHGAGDIRLMVGQSFHAFSVDGYVDVEPGIRVRGGPDPTEARFDAALGVRPRPAVLLLLQSFSSFAPPGAIVARSAYTKLQGSVVYDFSRTWSGQLGVVRTIFGQNAVRETGPLIALWYRF